jgi:hypothetical protein
MAATIQQVLDAATALVTATKDWSVKDQQATSDQSAADGAQGTANASAAARDQAKQTVLAANTTLESLVSSFQPAPAPVPAPAP